MCLHPWLGSILHQNINKNRERSRAAWQEFITARRFKPKHEQNSSLICRLEVGIEPPGGFWEKAQKLR